MKFVKEQARDVEITLTLGEIEDIRNAMPENYFDNRNFAVFVMLLNECSDTKKEKGSIDSELEIIKECTRRAKESVKQNHSNLKQALVSIINDILGEDEDDEEEE